ncbi:unnamed protein product [Fusarium graminearum]|nr:unnamed protein product [Fusarium graminearum]
MVDSTRPWVFEFGYAYDNGLLMSKDLFANGYSCNFLRDHGITNVSYVGNYQNLNGSVNDSVGQYDAICCPVHGRRDDDSAMYLQSDSMTTFKSFINSALLFEESIGGEIQKRELHVQYAQF